jgi:hypothetical protein
MEQLGTQDAIVVIDESSFIFFSFEMSLSGFRFHTFIVSHFTRRGIGGFFSALQPLIVGLNTCDCSVFPAFPLAFPVVSCSPTMLPPNGVRPTRIE